MAAVRALRTCQPACRSRSTRSAAAVSRLACAARCTTAPMSCAAGQPRQRHVEQRLQTVPAGRFSIAWRSADSPPASVPTDMHQRAGQRMPCMPACAPHPPRLVHGLRERAPGGGLSQRAVHKCAGRGARRQQRHHRERAGVQRGGHARVHAAHAEAAHACARAAGVGACTHGCGVPSRRLQRRRRFRASTPCPNRVMARLSTFSGPWTLPVLTAGPAQRTCQQSSPATEPRDAGQAAQEGAGSARAPRRLWPWRCAQASRKSDSSMVARPITSRSLTRCSLLPLWPAGLRAP